MNETSTSTDVSTDASTATLLIELADRLDVHAIKADTTVGRDRGCAIVIDHPTVSRLHARISHEPSGWRFQDLGSQNGSKLGEARTQTAAQLNEGTELHIGRVRAWFFANTVPNGWTPPDSPKLAGKLIRCVCGHIGWASIRAGDGLLRCTSCGRDIIRRDPNSESRSSMTTSRPSPTIAAPPSDCAACHTAIVGGEPMHACPDCGATMHSACWKENRGCATYGCPQVGVLDDGKRLSESSDTDAEAITPVLRPRTSGELARVEAFKQSLMAVAAFAAAGLPFFGVPPIGYAAYQLVGVDRAVEGNRRFVWAAISFAAGVVGFACSASWWLGIRW